jgi:hypothetical protein
MAWTSWIYLSQKEKTIRNIDVFDNPRNKSSFPILFISPDIFLSILTLEISASYRESNTAVGARRSFADISNDSADWDRDWVWWIGWKKSKINPVHGSHSARYRRVEGAWKSEIRRKRRAEAHYMTLTKNDCISWLRNQICNYLS